MFVESMNKPKCRLCAISVRFAHPPTALTAPQLFLEGLVKILIHQKRVKFIKRGKQERNTP